MRASETMVKVGALVAALALVLAACGGDDDDDGGGTTGGDTTTTGGETDTGGASDTGGDTDGQAAGPCDTPGVSDDEIVVGALLPTSGRAAGFYSQFQQGWDARIASQNADGGVGGRTITVEVADTAADPNRASEAAKELVEQKGVYAVIVDQLNTSTTAPYLNEQGIPVVGYNVTPEWGQFENMFGFNGSNSQDPTATPTTLGKFLVDQGGTKLASFGYASQAVEIAGNIAATSFEAAGGETVYQSYDAEPTGEWTRQANETVKAGADTVYLPLQTQLAVPAVQQLRQAGLAEDALINLPAGYGPSTIEQAGDTAEGLIFSTNFVPYEHELPVHQQILDDLAEYVPDATRSKEVTEGWMMGELLIRGIEEAGADCPTREAFITNLRAVDDYDAQGLLNPPVDFSEVFGKPINTCLHFVQVQDGEFVPLTDGTAICGELVGS